ncbi:hypothetical protein GCM10027051_02900 [Niabella terrae]
MDAFFKKHAPENQHFTIDAAAGGIITLASGTTITFPAGVFTDGSGAPVTGPVDIFARDILSANNMILADKPTLTDEGAFLESFGEIFVDARQNGNALKLNPVQKPVMVQVPIGVGADGNAREIPMWDGDTTITQTLSGYNHENASVSITQEILVRRGVAWSQIPGWGVSAGATTIFPLDALGEWRNCDALYSDPRPKTTVLGYFGDKFNPETGTNYMGQDPSMLLFKTAGTNSLIKLYNTIMLPAAGKEGFLSYQNTIPIGQEGTFLAISARNGKFYAEMRDVTIGTPDSGKDYVAFSFNLAEVSESQLLNLINQMSTK